MKLCNVELLLYNACVVLQLTIRNQMENEHCIEIACRFHPRNKGLEAISEPTASHIDKYIQKILWVSIFICMQTSSGIAYK